MSTLRVTAKPGLWTGLMDWTRGLTHCGHYDVAITFLSIVHPFPDEKFNIYSEQFHYVMSLSKYLLGKVCKM